MPLKVSNSFIIYPYQNNYVAGAVYVDSNFPTFQNINGCVFANNTGGISSAYLSWGTSANVTISNCQFLYGIADTGGAIYFRGISGTVSSTTFAYNTGKFNSHLLQQIQF